ncbi:zinc-binding oxidoreductase [Polyplosphaeria fusca]|uniref:Zinc-binding oxidoreductase n=1 Tax=Polyplosphaeria fusca TaxID=682080 RepID=A0A9P4UXX5_9PLEO|nr:zinc-binding oxidoreductase [Polyplosphaeria fusca]
MSSSKKSMRAWVHARRGDPSSVLSLSRLPIPTLSSSTQVLIQVTHCALNPGGSIMMHLVPFFFRNSPAIPEMDFAGIVLECGQDVPPDRNFQPGMNVFGSIPVGQHLKSTCGALAENIVVDHSSVMEIPHGANPAETAGLGIAGATALELMQAARLKRGESVLINGASGGIGHLVIQMCRNAVGETGKVVAVCSSDNIRWLEDLGCDEVVDYTVNEPVHRYLTSKYSSSRFSVVIDATGIQDIFNNSPGFLVETGSYVTVGPRASRYTYSAMLQTISEMATNMLWPRILGGVPRAYAQVTGISSPERLAQLRELVMANKLRVHVGTLVNLEDAQKAYAKLMSGHTQGKVVVRMT